MAVPKSKRQRILEDVLRRLAFITEANGYSSDLGESVLMGEDPKLGPDDPAAIVVEVAPDQGTMSGPRILAAIPIQVQAIVLASAYESPMLAAEAIIRDIVVALEIDKGEAKANLSHALDGTSAKGFVYSGTGWLTRQAGSEFVGAFVSYVANMERLWGDPD